MFGHIQANLADLSQEEKERYRSCYCGLCRCIGKRHGFLARLALSYDLTYLSMLLSALYEPEESSESCRCIIHPCKKKSSVTNGCTEYASDMTVALTYHTASIGRQSRHTKPMHRALIWGPCRSRRSVWVCVWHRCFATPSVV